MANFNDLNVDLDNEEAFQSTLYERTKENPNEAISEPCPACNESLNKYAKRFLGKLTSSLVKQETLNEHLR